jgi:hypothetical protein
VEEETTKMGVEVLASALVPCTTNRAVGEVEEMPILELALTVRMEVPEEEEMLKGSRVVEPWTLKEIVDEVALIPATVPLSKRMPVERLLAVVHLATSPGLPEPVRPEPAAAMVMLPGVVVVMVMLVPATKLVGAYLVPLPSAASS